MKGSDDSVKGSEDSMEGPCQPGVKRKRKSSTSDKVEEMCKYMHMQFSCYVVSVP